MFDLTEDHQRVMQYLLSQAEEQAKQLALLKQTLEFQQQLIDKQEALINALKRDIYYFQTRMILLK